jgi:hypothetical protein
MSSPLTVGRAIAWAAIFEVHSRRLPHWQGWVDELRQWASEQMQTEHERGEMPSHSGIPGAEGCTIMSTIERAPNGVLGGPPAQGSNRRERSADE